MRAWEAWRARMFEAFRLRALGRQRQSLLEMAPWEVSELDRHLLSYCHSLENTPTQQRACIIRGKELDVPQRKRFVTWLSKRNVDLI